MDSNKNPNLETTHIKKCNVQASPSSSSQDFANIMHHQHNIHEGLKRIHDEDEGFIFKNYAYDHDVIKKPTFLSSSSQDFKKIHNQHKTYVSKKVDGNKGLNFENPNCEVTKNPNGHVLLGSMTPPPALPLPPSDQLAEAEVESGRERLNRHRVEMAGRVRIPDIWGHEDLLKDWIDCTVFDSSLGNKTIMSARAALVQEGRSTRRIENHC